MILWRLSCHRICTHHRSEISLNPGRKLTEESSGTVPQILTAQAGPPASYKK